jgi:hypothetical protein
MPQLLARLIPSVHRSDVAFASRHRALRVILVLHIPLIVAVAL